MNKQNELRKECKYLKWYKGIPYYVMAEKIEMDKNSFYNFISNEKIKLGYKTEWLLEKYIKEQLYE